MPIISAGPLWVVTTRAAGGVWAADLEAHLPLRAVMITAVGDQRRVGVTARPVGDRRRIDLAWAVTNHLVAVAWHDAQYAGVALSVHLGGLTVTSTGDTMDGVRQGQDRAWWRARIETTLG